MVCNIKLLWSGSAGGHPKHKVTRNLTVSKRNKQVECQLWIEPREAKRAFDAISADREALVGKLGPQLIFDRMEGKKASVIYEFLSADVTDREQWPSLRQWLRTKGETYVAVFGPIVKQLELL